MDKPVPGWINYFYCFGGITFTLFLVQVLTGLLLSVHYTPSEAEAYHSIQRLHQVVPLGRLLRATHHWAANFMVMMILLHMLRVFLTGSYKNPRELNWIAGALLFVLILAFGFTGYLLPWDQKAYWATVIGTNMLGRYRSSVLFLRHSSGEALKFRAKRCSAFTVCTSCGSRFSLRFFFGCTSIY